MDLNQIWHGPPHMDPVGNLEILFWVVPPRGGIILEKLKKSKLPPYGPGRSGILLRHLLRHLLRIFSSFFFGGGIWILF